MNDAEDMPKQSQLTTVPDVRWKDRIEPYAEQSPVLDIPEGVVACQFCGNTRFRRSRVRLGDLPEALLLRLPLRCMRCNQRQYGSYLTACLANEMRVHGPRLSTGQDTWKAWTEQSTGSKLHRPTSTAMGTRATKLRVPVSGGQVDHQPAARTPRLGMHDEDRQIW